MKISRALAPLALGTTALLGLVGCAGGGDQQPGGAGDVAGNVTLRLWDENAAKAYEESIQAFENANPNVKVDINVVPWDNYFTSLRTDVASGTAEDVFWLNGSYYSDYADEKLILPIGPTLGADAASQWNESIVQQYTRNNELWGVPQITDGGTAIYYNADALKAAGVTPEEVSAAKWSPNEAEDTFLPLLKKLTLDAEGRNAADPAFDANNVKQYAFNSAQELQNIILPFIGSNGGTYQDEAGKLTFTNPKTVEAFRYITNLINEEHVAPPASSTNDSGDFTRDEFIRGNIALFESGTYSLAPVHEAATFEWGITEIPAGPAGKVTTSPGVIAAGNANSKNPGATRALLEWLGSVEGATYLGSNGAAVPAHNDARSVYDQYWEQQGVEVEPFFSVVDGKKQIPPVTGKNFAAMYAAFQPKLNEVFLGRVDLETGLKQAEDAGNAAA